MTVRSEGSVTARMNESIVIFETPVEADLPVIRRYLRRSCRVYVIERFFAYHHTALKPYPFFPPHRTAQVARWIKEGAVEMLPAAMFDSRSAWSQPADLAVQTVEQVFPFFAKRYQALIGYVTAALGSPMAEGIFRQTFCHDLGIFYSLNRLLHRIALRFPGQSVKVYPQADMRRYEFLREIVQESGVAVLPHPNVVLPRRHVVRWWLRDMASKGLALARLGVEWLAGLRRVMAGKSTAARQNYKYAVTVVNPLRQLRGSQRGPDFFVDGERIRRDEMVYISMRALSDEQTRCLRELGGGIFPHPAGRGYVRQAADPLRLLGIAIGTRGLLAGELITQAYHAVLVYGQWTAVTERLSIRHFVTHSDRHPMHIARNLALNKAGVETWHFTDSINGGPSFIGVLEGCREREPARTCVYYDHFIVWHQAGLDWMVDHSWPPKDIPIVGSLWAQQILGGAPRDELLRAVLSDGKEAGGKFLVAAYSSTYTVNSFLSYDEGIAFARDLKRLAQEFPDLFLVLKEKFPPRIHRELDPDKAEELLAVYDEMGRLPNVQILPREAVDTSALTGVADLVISFPFTSTTFEALSVGRAALWHDPLAFYGSTPYAKTPGVLTHGYFQLQARVLEIRAQGPGHFRDPIPPGSPLMDPYRDGKAIDRFRELLCRA